MCVCVNFAESLREIEIKAFHPWLQPVLPILDLGILVLVPDHFGHPKDASETSSLDRLR